MLTVPFVADYRGIHKGSVLERANPMLAVDLLRALVVLLPPSRMQGLIRFAFRRKIGRLEYFVRLLVCELIVAYLLVFHDGTEPSIALTALVIRHYAAFSVIWPRLRDCGMKGIWVLLSFMPLIFLGLSVVLLFKPPEYRFLATPDEEAQAV
jgi:hypothetical protein